VADAVTIGDAESLARWLGGKPADWAQAIAARVALRVLPTAGLMRDVRQADREALGRLFLALFRANFISWAARSYDPAHEMGGVANDAARNASLRSAAPGAAAAAAHAAAAAGASQTSDTAAAIRAATDAADAAAHAAADAQSTRAYAAVAKAVASSIAAGAGGEAAAQVWKSIEDDARYLVTGASSRQLMLQPLWVDNAGSGPNLPAWASRPLESMAEDADLGAAGFGHWMAWYRSLLPGGRDAKPESYFGEELDLRIASQRDEWWDRDPKTINADITGWLRGPPPLPPPPLATPADESNLEAEFLHDASDPGVDYLARSDLAFVLAGRINLIWDELNSKSSTGVSPPASAAGSGSAENARPLDAGFVIHVDAPWGGGKTTFAGFVGRILNASERPGEWPEWLSRLPLADPRSWPEKYRRPWHVVQFNAWQHQHVSPPWWVFYQAIRKQVMDSIWTARRRGKSGPKRREAVEVATLADVRRPSWLHCWAAELWWRFWTPEIRNKLVITLIGVVVVALLFLSGFLRIDEKGAASADSSHLPPLISVVVAAVVGGAPLVWTVLAALGSTLLPGTPEAAKNYSLGAGDPLDRFRRHFGLQIRRFSHPILVVVDDLDRCEPGYVVELVRGMQTILKSPRVVFMLLGDRDWISECFTKVHDAMKGIHVGREHEFGQRFVEKAIQFSFVLPDISVTDRQVYVHSLLGTAPADTAPSPASVTLNETGETLAGAIERAISVPDALHRETVAQQIRSQVGREGVEHSEALLSEFDRRLSLRAAADTTAEKATRHRLEAIASILPANPRQIKRIINAISLLQEAARIKQATQPGSEEWRVLALWIVLMIEWPRSWFTLSTYPGLADRVRNPRSSRAHLPETGWKAYVSALKGNERVMSILNFRSDDPEWGDCSITAAHVLKLREIVPPASGEFLSITESKGR